MSRESSGNGNLTLVLGVDGSGKSTFLNILHERTGVAILEPTSTPEAKQFKIDNHDVLVDENLIRGREAMFLRLNRQLERDIDSDLHAGLDVVTTGGSLVTLVSHALMRAVISVRDARAVDRAVDQWLDSDTCTPDDVVLVHAPDEVIRSRIEQRQRAGNKTERFWGFNSPFFLSRYQETLHLVTDKLAHDAVARCVMLDSSNLTPDEMVDSYEA